MTFAAENDPSCKMGGKPGAQRRQLQVGVQAGVSEHLISDLQFRE